MTEKAGEDRPRLEPEGQAGQAVRLGGLPALGGGWEA